MADSRTKQLDVLDLFSGIGYKPRPRHPDSLEYENPELRQALGPISVSDSFNFFNHEDLGEAKKYYIILLAAATHEDFMRIARDAKKRMNKRMFAFATSWAIQDSPLYAGIYTPPVEEHSPEYFIPYESIVEAIFQFYGEKNLPVIIHPTGSPESIEQKVAYFREDIGINSHHWHWHLVYPYDAKGKDRQGELFYYMHQQMVARYDAERLSVGYKRVVPLREYGFDDILMGYSSHLSLDHGKRSASRPDGMSIKRTTNLVRWRERIMEAIHNGFLVTEDGQQIPLYNEDGINLLGAALEARAESVNQRLYGSLHNTMHNEIARVQDVNRKFEELAGAIGDISTAVRDPAFFRIHKLVDNIFTELKNQLPPYGKDELNFEGIAVTNVNVESSEMNVISTSMKKGRLRLNYAISFLPKDEPVEIEYEHLDHEPFSYNITVANSSGMEKEATVRIFMAPKYGEHKALLKLSGRRRHFIELDKFTYTLKIGENHITRRSAESTVTIKSEKRPSFEKLYAMARNEAHNFEHNKDDYCSCGWPQHLLVPRGKPQGMVFRLFVMLTDYKEDCVDLTGTVCIDRQGENANDPSLCKGSLSYCGVKNSKYPDKRAMGFPFDRPIAKPPKECDRDPTDICEEAAFKTPNMYFTDVTVQFKESA